MTASDLTDLLSTYADLAPCEWYIAARTEVRNHRDALTGSRVDVEPGIDGSFSLSLMLAKAAEMNAGEDPGAVFLVTDGKGTEIDAPRTWVGYLVTIDVAGSLWPVELEMNLELAQKRASVWRKSGARLRAHTFAGDSYYAYTKLARDCAGRRDAIDDLKQGWEC